MNLAEQAEGYIKEESMPDEHGRQQSLSRSQYDADASRREWEQQFS